MFEKRYVPTGNGCGHYAILNNGTFFESCDIGEVAQRMRELCGEAAITREHLTKLAKEAIA